MQLTIPETLKWQNNQLHLLDQRILPHKIEYLEIQNIEEAWHAINTLAVRGAPAIGVAAGFALAQAMLGESSPNAETLNKHGDYLKSSRPTAVNLAWAVDRLVKRWHAEPTTDALVAEATAIYEEDLAICRKLGEHGADLINPDSGVLTHCNAGSLAVSRLGTATAPMYTQHAKGIPFRVFADETRPLYQGARLTAWELDQAGIDVTLICDNMAATKMSHGEIDLVIVGTDRVAANGDVVNKIGTFNVAILCQYFDIPFYVACPSSTFDAATPTGADVPIEERDTKEVLGDHAAEVKVANPAFDVTPAELVTGIITEYGVTEPGDIANFLKDR